MTKRNITLSFIKKEVHRLDPQLKESEDSFKTAVIMLAALKVGTDVEALARFTGLPEPFIAERVGRLKAAGVFTQDGICAEWFDDESGGVAFWCDVAVAEGLLQRTEDAKYVEDKWPDLIDA